MLQCLNFLEFNFPQFFLKSILLHLQTHLVQGGWAVECFEIDQYKCRLLWRHEFEWNLDVGPDEGYFVKLEF